MDNDIYMHEPMGQNSENLSLQNFDSSSVSLREATILKSNVTVYDADTITENSSSSCSINASMDSPIPNNNVIPYDAETFTENDISSVDSLYYVSTVCNSTVHDLNVSPLPAHGNLANLGLRGKGMHIGHLNVRGIRSGEKLDQIKVMLQSSENDICMLGLSESKLGCEIPDSFLQIENFQCFRKDKIQGSGGLLIYVKNNVACNRREDLEHVNFESVWLEVFPTCSKSFLVGHFYRNPQSNIAWNETFDDQLEKVMEEDKEIFILGDFNRDLLNLQIKQQWLDYMNSHGLVQHIDEATRVVPNHSKTLIDHVYSNFSDNVHYTDVPKIGLSDHYPVFLTRKTSVHIPKTTHHTIKYRSFKHFDESKFNEDLNSIPWDVIKVFDNVNDALDTWYSLFSEVIDKHVPLKQHRVKHVNQPMWLTSEVIESIKTRDRFKALGNTDQYKIWRNKVVNLIRKSKKSHYQNLIEEGKNQPTTIWKIFNEFGAGKQKSDKTNSIHSVKAGGQDKDKPEDIANAFNDFFVNIAENIKEPVSSSNHEKLKSYCNDKIPSDIFFDLPLLNKDKVLRYLKNLDVRKSTGSDELGPRLLKMAAPFISESLTYICNMSITTGTFPEKWKEAKVKPLHKAGPANDLNNFRPISILPVLSKLFEKHAHDSLMKFLEKYNLLYETQSGFRPNHSCETALVYMIDKWLKALDKGELVGVILVDFRKAFDLVDHDILKEKLSLYKINSNSLQWFSSYLDSRKQRVSFNNVLSNQEHVKCGVPQGSILGPLLFLLFINDLPFHTGVSTDLYADDTTLYEINISKENIEYKLQNALSDLSRWCKQNGMVINLDKTKVMLITTRQKRNRIDDTLKIVFNDLQLSTVSDDKVLGVHIDNNLLWSEHINKVTRKMSTNIWLLSKIKNYL
ncbi:MAG: reverse transcriptase family protein, partial [Candidatus Thiodiazotropha sp.]